MYDQFDSLAAAKRHYRRCRTRKDFILTEKALKRIDPVCVRCRRRLSEDQAEDGYRGNRCVYLPQTKRVVVLHYVCAWENVLGAVFSIEQLI
jgi:hypothetical protein